jgi:hypothetical protein
MHAQVAAENQIVKDKASGLEANDVSQRQELAELRERVKDIPACSPRSKGFPTHQMKRRRCWANSVRPTMPFLVLS